MQFLGHIQQVVARNALPLEPMYASSFTDYLNGRQANALSHFSFRIMQIN